MKKLNSKLFENNIIDNDKLNNISGGAGGTYYNTQYKDGRPDYSSSSDGDKCWSIGSSDTVEDCSITDLGGDDLSTTSETSIGL